jgi:sialate O-acetylesterase
MQLSLASVFTDHMVLQQGMPIPVWGLAAPDSTIEITLAGSRVGTRADSAGRWKVELPAMAASAEPREIIVTASGRGLQIARLSCRDVLVGEVWVCSGQSNMEWSVSLSVNGAAEIAAAEFSAIRLFTVPQRVADTPMADIPGATWTICSPETVATFSAVGYFFGRELHRRLGVPIGLINSSWGGTVAEAWTSRDGLLGEPSLRPIVENYEKNLPELVGKQAPYLQEIRELETRTRDVSNQGFSRGWAAMVEPAGEWNDMLLPSDWQTRGLHFSGIFWFRRTVEIPPAWAGKDLRLAIGATDKSDVTYFNGTPVGSVTMRQRPDAWSFQRTYTVPGDLVRAGRNVIAVRVHSDKYLGGMIGPGDAMNLSCPMSGDATEISLTGSWRYAVEANYGLVQMPAMPMGPGNPNVPSALFNGMIAPLLPFLIRGVIWYQGESNVDRANQYRTLFPTLIKNWRRNWNRKDLAFHFVQLANYMPVQDQPAESQWAELREAQLMTLDLPHTGMAVAIDVGEANDIHPRNKQDVGLRLAFSALHETYGLKNVTAAGPMFRKSVQEGRTMRLLFDHVEEGLVCRGEKLRGFVIAGPDGVFVESDAVIDGVSLIVSCPRVPNPKAVRYAWADNPICNLYNSAGLPASPFRTDRN